MDYSLPGSSVHEILQAKILEWVAIPFSRDVPNPGNEPGFPALQMDSLPSEQPGKPLIIMQLASFLDDVNTLLSLHLFVLRCEYHRKITKINLPHKISIGPCTLLRTFMSTVKETRKELEVTMKDTCHD